MRIPVVPVAIVAAAVLSLSACSSTSAPGGSDAAPSSARGPVASAATGAASGSTGDSSAPAAAAGGDPTTNACGLLTVDEIKQAVGFAVNPGVLQNSDNQSDCEWASTQSDTATVGLTVSTYDDFMWQAGSGAGNSKPVSGIGDAAFKGWPTSADLTVKANGYQVVMAIIDFQAKQDAIDSENLALAKLVLPRL
jgi:hypothetical protein